MIIPIMPRRIFHAAVLALFCLQSGQAQDLEPTHASKLSGEIRQLQRIRSSVDRGHLRVTSSKDTLYHAFVWKTDEHASIGGALGSAGINQVRGSQIATALLSLDDLVALASDENVAFVELGSVGVKSNLDAARPISLLASAQSVESEVRADSVKNWFDLQGLDTIVGIVDGGVDVSHPDFIEEDASGTPQSRIIAYWDQRGAPGSCAPGVDMNQFGYGYGCLYENAHINACISSGCGLGASGDRSKHGTPVTGAAAGNGRDPASTSGIASKAGLLIVNLGRNSTQGLDAARWVAQRSIQLDRPWVANYSFQFLDLPNDRGSAFERGLFETIVNDDAFGLGRILTAAMGNDYFTPGISPNLNRVHAMDSTNTTIFIEVNRSAEPNDEQVRYALWHNEQVDLDAIAIQLESPSGQLYPDSGSCAQFAPNCAVHVGDTQFNLGTPEGFVTIRPTSNTALVNDGLLEASNAHRIEIQLLDDISGGSVVPIASGTWKIRVLNTKNVEFDIYKALEERISYIVQYDNERTVRPPATVSVAVPVGAYISKSPAPSETLGDITHFSSIGPVRAQFFGGAGEDVEPLYAPGGYGLDLPTSGGGVAAVSGTSFASPIVAGIASQIMQIQTYNNDPLAYFAIRESLFESASISTSAQRGIDFKKVDALDAVLYAIEEDSFSTLIDDSLNVNDVTGLSTMTAEEYWITPNGHAVVDGRLTMGATDRWGKTLVSRIHVAGKLTFESTADVRCDPGAEIAKIGNGVIDIQPGAVFEMDCPEACVIVKGEGGEFRIGAGAVARFMDGSFLASRSGTIVLEDNATLTVVSSAGESQIEPGTTFLMGENADLTIKVDDFEMIGTAANPIRIERLDPTKP